MASAAEHSDAGEDVFRPLANFPECIWGDRFFDHNVDDLHIEGYAKEIDPLKQKVRSMLVDDSCNEKDKLDMINILDRLGISYHFEDEIEDQLNQTFKAYSYENDYDLYTTSVHFRVFRQHGYKISCDIFNKFKDEGGKLGEELTRDVRGILSLYEASQLRMHGEEFMDEVLDLTTRLLESMASESANSKVDDDVCRLYKQVSHAVKQSFHTGIQRVETRYFITVYEEDKSRNEVLLRLAKLDFNMLQLLHRKELSHIVRWWHTELNVKRDHSYARDRSMECHFWAVGPYYEARYSRARLLMSKVYSMISMLDDTYDAFGTKHELRLLSQAFEGWDISAIDELPGKMKLVFKNVLNVYTEIESEMVKEDREYAARYAKESVLNLIRTYYKEVEWANDNHIPSFEEYMTDIGRITSVAHIVPTSAMLGMEPEIASELAFQWAANPNPQVIRGAQVVGRLMNDIVSHQDEQQRGIHVVSGVECYMNEYSVSREQAVVASRAMIREAWKDMNEGLVKPTAVSPRIISLVFNITRMRDALYKEIDGYTHSAKVMKDDAHQVYDEAFVI